VLDVPSNVTDGDAHVKFLSSPAFAFGIGLTLTAVVATLLIHPLTVMVSEYVPAITAVAFTLTVGFCEEEENAFGPVHVYVAPATAPVLKLSDEPAHTGPLSLATGVTGGFTTTVVVPAILVHPLTVTVTEYIPAMAVVALALTEGSSLAEVNVFGPVHA
jgi:hypothetical protein